MNDPGFPWRTMLGDEHGELVRVALAALADVPAARIAEAITDIERAETLGPFTDPSAWTGDLFERSRDWNRMLRLLLPLVTELNILKARADREGETR
jgi:hypothetical protein